MRTEGAPHIRAGSGERGLIERRKFLSHPALMSDSPLVVSAPSGYGKTSFARQMAMRHHPVLWIDCSEERLTTTEIADRVEGWSGTHASQPHTSICSTVASNGFVCLEPLVILEDVDLVVDLSTPESLIADIVSRLERAPRIFATTARATHRSAGRRAEAHLEGFVYLFHDDMRLSAPETPGFATALGARVAPSSPGDRSRLFERTFGIPALVALTADRGHDAEAFRESVGAIIEDWVRANRSSPELVGCALAGLLLGGGPISDIATATGSARAGTSGITAVPFLNVDRTHLEVTTFDLPPSLIAGLFGGFSRMRGIASRAAEVLAQRGAIVRSAEVIRHAGSATDIAAWLDSRGEALLSAGKIVLYQDLEERLRAAGVMPSVDTLLGAASASWVTEGARRAVELLESALQLELDVGEREPRSRDRLLAQSISRSDVLGARRLLGRRVQATPYSEALWLTSDAAIFDEAAGIVAGHIPADLEVSSVRFRALASRSEAMDAAALTAVARIADGGWVPTHPAATPTSLLGAALEAENAIDAVLRGEVDSARRHLANTAEWSDRPGMEALRVIWGGVAGVTDAIEGDSEGIEKVRAAIDAHAARGETWMSHLWEIAESVAWMLVGVPDKAVGAARNAATYFTLQPWELTAALANVQFAAALVADGRTAEARERMGSVRAVWDGRTLPAYLDRFSRAVSSVLGLDPAVDTSTGREGGEDGLFETALARALRGTASAIRREVSRSGGPRADTERRFDGLTIRLFGRFEITNGIRTLSDVGWAKRKSRLLLAAMVLRRGRDLPREVIYQRLWPAMQGKQVKDNFYVTWSNLRRGLATLGDPSLFISNAGGICRVDPKRVTSDVADFERLVDDAVTCSKHGDVDGALDRYLQLARIYEGPLLGGEMYDDWFSLERQAYHDRFVEAMTLASDIARRSGDAPLSLWFARRGLEADSTREESYLAMMRAQRDANQRSGALETFYRCKDYLAEELGLDPSEDTMLVYQDLLVMESRAGYRRRGHLESAPAGDEGKSPVDGGNRGSE